MNQKPETENSATSSGLQSVNMQLIPVAYHKEDEFNLYDFWQLLVNYKYFIAIITLVCTIIAIVSALYITPVYQAEAYIYPPEQRDLEGLNVTKKI